MMRKNPPQHLFHVARNILNLQMKHNIRVKRVQHRNIQIYFCNIQIYFCNIHIKHLQHFKISTATL